MKVASERSLTNNGEALFCYGMNERNLLGMEKESARTNTIQLIADYRGI